LTDKFNLSARTTNHAGARSDPTQVWRENPVIIASLHTFKQPAQLDVARTVNRDPSEEELACRVVARRIEPKTITPAFATLRRGSLHSPLRCKRRLEAAGVEGSRAFTTTTKHA
jgi:hypothetical protein